MTEPLLEHLVCLNALGGPAARKRSICFPDVSNRRASLLVARKNA